MSETIEKGIVYMSRIPPKMIPSQIKSLLSSFGEITKIYLEPAPINYHTKHSKITKFTQGWIEFANKKVAKRVALLLNGELIGGKKGYKYHDDIWTLKYLSKFKWSDLTQKISVENAFRDQKLNLHLEQSRKETSLYLKQVELAQSLEGMERKGKRKTGQEAFYKQRKVIE